MSRARGVTALLNLLVLAVFAGFVLHFGWRRLLAPWRQIDGGIITLALAGLAASYGLRALRIYLAEADIPRGRYPDCLRLILINNAMNLLLPARAGEASFPVLMRRWFGIDPARATGTLLWLRLLDLHVLATIGGASAALGWLTATALSGIAAAGAIAGALAPLALFVLHGHLASRLDGRDGRGAGLLRRVLRGVPDRGGTVALALLLPWSAWSVKLAVLAGVLAQLAAIPFALGVLGVIGGDLSTVLPLHAPGGFGTYEAGALALLAPGTGTDGTMSTLLTAVVGLHVLVLTAALAAGALAWLAGWRKRPAGPPDPGC